MLIFPLPAPTVVARNVPNKLPLFAKIALPPAKGAKEVPKLMFAP